MPNTCQCIKPPIGDPCSCMLKKEKSKELEIVLKDLTETYKSIVKDSPLNADPIFRTWNADENSSKWNHLHNEMNQINIINSKNNRKSKLDDSINECSCKEYLNSKDRTKIMNNASSSTAKDDFLSNSVATEVQDSENKRKSTLDDPLNEWNSVEYLNSKDMTKITNNASSSTPKDYFLSKSASKEWNHFNKEVSLSDNDLVDGCKFPSMNTKFNTLQFCMNPERNIPKLKESSTVHRVPSPINFAKSEVSNGSFLREYRSNVEKEEHEIIVIYEKEIERLKTVLNEAEENMKNGKVLPNSRRAWWCSII